MDGLEATRIIRTLEKARNLPIIAVTANAMKESKEEGFSAGMNDYITKPIEPRQLLHILSTWL
jgi:CheY-like chemotaxis protein